MALTEQKLFIAELNLNLAPENKHLEKLELTRSYPTRDASDRFVSDPIFHLMERAASELRDLIYDGKISEDQIISITVRELREDENRGETV